MSVVRSSPFAPTSSTSIAANSTPPTRSVSDFLSSKAPLSSLRPSQSYVILCKVVLQRRLRNMFGLTGFATYLLLLVAVFDPKELPGSLVNFLPVLLFAPFAFLGALPVFIHRKRTITTALPSASTRFAQLDSLRRPIAVTAFFTYLVAVVPLHFAYIWCTTYTSTEPRLGLLFYHSGRDAYQLNERRILLALLHLALAAFATCDHVVNSRSRLEFDDGQARTIPQRLAARAQARVTLVVRSVLVGNALFYSSYILLRRPILRFLIVNFAGPWARPYVYSLLKHNAAYSITLATRSLMSSFLILGVWEAAHICFAVYATQPMNVSQFAANTNQCLISGLRHNDPYYQQFAFLELEHITLTNPERRKAIFTDIKPDSARCGAWAEISRECLLLIGTELQRAKGRGRIAASPASSALASGAASTSTPAHSKSTVPVRSESVFRPTKKTLLDTLAGTSNGSAAPPAAKSSAVATSSSSLSSRVPSIFQTASSSSEASTLASSAVTSTASAVRSPTKTLEEKLSALIPKGWQSSLFSTLPTHVVDVCVARRHEVICAIQALANLLCASLKEDKYGVAQKDIPRVLEAFVLYLNALDSLATSLSALAESSSDKSFKEQVQRAVSEQIGAVQIALREGIREVLAEFGPYLSTEFRFPTNIAHRLQLIADWG